MRDPPLLIDSAYRTQTLFVITTMRPIQIASKYRGACLSALDEAIRTSRR